MTRAVLERELAATRAERDAAQARETALAEVLQAINASSGKPEPVFDMIIGKAMTLCDAAFGALLKYEKDHLSLLAHRNGSPALVGHWSTPQLVDPSGPTGRALHAGETSQIVDLAESEYYRKRLPMTVASVELGHIRTLVQVPLRSELGPVGLFILYRQEVRPFTDRQIALVGAFAAQAEVAMENARLFSGQREALEQQTATADILHVISQSPTDIEPVMAAVARAAVRFCGAEDAHVFLRDGDEMVSSAHEGPLSSHRHGYRDALDASNTARAETIVDARITHLPDTLAPEAEAAYRSIRENSIQHGFRAQLNAPMLKDGQAIGCICLRRREPGAFTPRQIALLETFASQAVIAIENVRLFTELRESLDQQTATSDVLKTISRSPVNLDTVLDTLVETVARLCRADQAYMFRRQGELHHLVAAHGLSREAQDYIHSHPFEPNDRTLSGRVVQLRQTVHITDILEERDYGYTGGQQVAGFRTMLGIPLLAQDTVVGVFVVTRTRVEPFSEKEIALAAGFADQAVIAIENTRLFEELRERQSELRVTFDNMGDAVVMFDAGQRLAAWNRNFQEMLDVPDSFMAGRPTLDDYVRLLVGRGELGEVDPDTEIARLRGQFERQWSTERTRPNGRILEVRNNPVPDGGAVLIYSDITERKKAEANIRSARDAAEAALLQLKAAQANLVQSEKMASLGQLTAGIAHEIKNPLNFVNNFATLSVDLLDELKEIAGPALDTLDADKRAELDETMGLLTGNLGKIAEHGKRADGIVRSMLSHSRGGSGDWQASDINALVEEALNLAYHGARAQDKEFNVTLERDFETGMPIEVVPQDVMRVFLNLFGNGFYATNKRRLTKETGYRPALKVSTRDLGDAVEVKVRDNGIGIPAEVRAKLFQPFFTTKPTGEGTGLGLSISYDIVTQQHGGAIAVESEVGDFTEFTVRLPRAPRIASAKRV